MPTTPGSANGAFHEGRFGWRGPLLGTLNNGLIDHAGKWPAGLRMFCNSDPIADGFFKFLGGQPRMGGHDNLHQRRFTPRRGRL